MSAGLGSLDDVRRAGGNGPTPTADDADALLRLATWLAEVSADAARGATPPAANATPAAAAPGPARGAEPPGATPSD